jgi:hypothetical protein
MHRAVGHAQIVAPRPAGHPGKADDLALRDRRKDLADQIDISDPIHLIVVGDAALAVAEADLGTDIQFDIGARRRSAAKGATSGPAVAGKWPGDLPPLKFPIVGL